MFLHFNMRRLKAIEVSDSGNHGEFYFTWRCFVDRMDDDLQLAQGFSMGCPIDDGYSMLEGEERILNDPKVTIKLPDVAEGETNQISLDLFSWEADHSAEEVKKLFTNDAVAKLMQIHEAAKHDTKKTREAFLAWIQDGDNEVIKALVAAGALGATAVAPYVAASAAAVKVFEWTLDTIKDNSDDFLGFARAELIYTRKGGELSYRWIFNDGVGTWFNEEQPMIGQSWRVLEANRGNQLESSFLVQVVSESPHQLMVAPPA